MSNRIPSQELLREWLDYDEQTGIFRWKKARQTGGRMRAGDVAGTRRGKYIFIGVAPFSQIGAHRLAWIYVHGVTIGGAEIDHKDCNPTNNSIGNLRLATSSQQKQNRGAQSNNQCGLKGAFYHAAHKGKKWRSQIKVGDRLIFLGYFHTAEEAHEAYGRAAIEHFGEFARTA